MPLISIRRLTGAARYSFVPSLTHMCTITSPMWTGGRPGGGPGVWWGCVLGLPVTSLSEMFYHLVQRRSAGSSGWAGCCFLASSGVTRSWFGSSAGGTTAQAASTHGCDPSFLPPWLSDLPPEGAQAFQLWILCPRSISLSLSFSRSLSLPLSSSSNFAFSLLQRQQQGFPGEFYKCLSAGTAGTSLFPSARKRSSERRQSSSR